MSLGKILIIDDDKNICDLLRIYLEKEGYSTIISNNGEEGMVKFYALKPDIIPVWTAGRFVVKYEKIIIRLF